MDPQVVSILYIVALFALLYFLFIRPQQKRQKQHQKMLGELQVNDEITTVGGILGTVVKIKEDTVVLRLADNVRVEFLKNAVGQVRKKANEPKED
ncbi:preprotein translocase subunit YajC [Peptococcaceae bacterium 1198_IL3148]